MKQFKIKIIREVIILHDFICEAETEVDATDLAHEYIYENPYFKGRETRGECYIYDSEEITT